MLHSLLRRFAVPLALLALTIAVQGAAPRQVPQAAVEQSAAVTTVGFRVISSDGTPVRDLKPGEVTLKVGGRTREIVAMEFMQAGGAPGASQAVASAPAPFLTNAPSGGGGRDVLLVVDDDGIGSGREQLTKDALTKLVDALTPADRVEWNVINAPASRLHLTTARDSVKAAIARLTGRALRNEASQDALCRSRRNLDVLLTIFEGVTPSVPTLVVFVSNGLAAPTAMDSVGQAGRGATQVGMNPANQSGPCELRGRDFDELTTAAAVSGAHVFGLQVIDDTLSGQLPPSDMAQGFESVAGVSGNGVIRLIGNYAPAVGRIASETSAYYVAAFAVPMPEQNGSKQRVEVSVSRPGALVRAFTSVTMPKSGAPAKPAALKVRDVLTVSKVYRDVTLRMAVHTSRATPDGKMRIVCLFEPTDAETTLAEASIAVFDEKGAARTQNVGAADLKQSPVIVPMAGPGPGTYRVRLAAKDASGAVGTLDETVTIDAPEKGGVSVGPLVLGAAGQAGFAPRLQFGAEPVAFGVVEIFGAPKAANVTAVFELAASETSPALATLPGTVQAVRDDLRMASMRFPIEKMPAGDVVVRAKVTVDGKVLDVTRVKTLRKVTK